MSRSHDSFDSSAGRAEDCRLPCTAILRLLVQLWLEGVPFGSGPDPAAPLPFGPARVAPLQGLPGLELLPEVAETTSQGSLG